MTTHEPKRELLSWHAEISGELTEAKAALSPLQAELNTAETDARRATAALRKMQSVLAEIKRPAGPLVLRLREYEADRDAAAGRVARARGAVEAARGKAGELEHALGQIDGLLHTSETEEAA